MLITFDPAKDATNLAKHGVSLAQAEHLDWATALLRYDERYDYGEVRIAGLGFIGSRLYFVVYVQRDETCRIISLRKANNREKKIYAEAQT
ncbi:MAG TPA: BrnT family toxin [Alphaproteobacteria bacterium]|nr:BrnT family toxin [Alphaproteobacteria bacterium]